jgi:hypothetical protein
MLLCHIWIIYDNIRTSIDRWCRLPPITCCGEFCRLWHVPEKPLGVKSSRFFPFPMATVGSGCRSWQCSMNVTSLVQPHRSLRRLGTSLGGLTQSTWAFNWDNFTLTNNLKWVHNEYIIYSLWWCHKCFSYVLSITWTIFFTGDRKLKVSKAPGPIRCECQWKINGHICHALCSG